MTISLTQMLIRAGNVLLRPFSLNISRTKPPKPPKPPKPLKPPKPRRLPKPIDVRLDLRGATDDPIAGAYRSGGAPFILDVAIDRLRLFTPLYLRCALNAGNPFVETVAAYARGDAMSYENTPLEAFYETWHPANAAEAIGLDETDASPELLSASPFGAVFPWQPSEKLAERTIRTKRAIERENQAHGEILNSDGGHKFFGPVSQAKGRLEFARLTRTYDSIRQNGYIPMLNERYSYPSVKTVLVGENAWVGLVAAGHHRMAALTVLNWISSPITFKSRRLLIVRREDVARWPGVTSELFSPEQALALFDRIIAGDIPDWYRKYSGTGMSPTTAAPWPIE